ncbi:MAG: serine protease [Candidatus Handelsmanbacteria bacterium RIFCSPLOWO2_12_FULL_64_10]|uniref:Serine protease n=1 Tax=Handelsmanbacteria sp. (strain RIFCSPLOWO2_12_FULL_64_10) TaxID=1817868 RepID=A0A1F6C9G8_HANXR|nr:MAG: serine protease [Candidatus Handelsmanbacteria bacterium RIFCSPLOWO2_12_FULL_64_10]
MKTALQIGLTSLLCLLTLPAVSRGERPIRLVEVEGPIGPVVAEFLVDAIRRATLEKSECLIVQLDTPGGLDASMRTIIKEMLASETPIVVYVAPAGSRAASAGALITIAAHVAAMAPGTNIGAAHPVGIGGQIDSTMAGKVTNDAAAYIRSIAERRGRNVQWAEDAVRKSVSATEQEALKLKIIDLVCPTVSALVDSLNGRRVEVTSGPKVLATKGLRIARVRMGMRERFLATLSDPNIAYILMILGFYGLLFEIYNPGSVLPGVVGSICIILAFFSFQTLSVNYAGLILILLGIVMFILEVKIISHGALTLGGIVAMVLGSTMLFESPEPFLRVSWLVIIPAVLASAGFILFAVGLGLQAQRRRPVTGVNDLVGKVGAARTEVHVKGMVFVSGEYWSATSETPIEAGAEVRVRAVNGPVLTVEKVKE